MRIFLGYFIWGLILSVPIALVFWKLDLMRSMPRWIQPRHRRAVRLPVQLEGIVIRGKRQRVAKEKRV